MKPINSFILFSSSVWLILLSLIIFKVGNIQSIREFIQYIEIAIHFYLIFLSYKIYKRIISYKDIFIWFLIFNIFFCINDLTFLFIIFAPSFNINISTFKLSLFQLLINNVPFSIWLICIITFLVKIITKFILRAKYFIQLVSLLFVINSVVICRFFLPETFSFTNINAHTTFLITSFGFELMVFNLAILGLVYSETRSISFILSGFIILITGDFLVDYARIINTTTFFGYDSLLWLAGMFLMLFGVVDIFYANNLDLKNWFRSHASIKRRITAWSLCISSGSFFLFFLIASYFGIINQNSFIIIPLFIMVYSIVLVILSLYMGKVFETPFKKIELNINSILLNKEKSYINSKFAIEEFTQMQEFLMTAFSYKENQDLLRKKLGDMGGALAHDLGTPINAINICIKELKESNAPIELMTILETSVSQIQAFSKEFLAHYRISTDSSSEFEGDNVPKFIILSKLLKSIIDIKKLEWSRKSCNISLDFSNDSHTTWVFVDVHKFERHISNLLNNAYESSNKESHQININISKNYNFVKIEIKDNGCGIDEYKIKEVLSGKSTKHEGRGLGLSNAVSYFNNINGVLELKSKINEGSRVIIKLPINICADWMFDTIKYEKSNIFIVIDDDINIIKRWQKILQIHGISGKYFINISEYNEWCKAIANFDNYVLIIDYDLNDKDLNGIDILESSPIVRSRKYLVTGRAETNSLQNLCTKQNIKLTSKYLIEAISFISE